jgi:hypothetical protein
LNEVVDEVYSAHISALLLDLIDTTQFAQGGVASVFRRHSVCDVFLSQVFEVEAKFVAEFPFDTTAPEQRPEPQREFVKPASHSSSQPSAISKRLPASARRFLRGDDGIVILSEAKNLGSCAMTLRLQGFFASLRMTSSPSLPES